MEEKMLLQNKESWDAIVDDWFDTTALPTYGVLIPDETKLNSMEVYYEQFHL